MGNSIINTFFHTKTARVLIELLNKKETYSYFLSKEIDITYSHLVKVIKKYEDVGILTSKKVGRTNIIKLTPKGKEIAKHIESIFEVLR